MASSQISTRSPLGVAVILVACACNVCCGQPAAFLPPAASQPISPQRPVAPGVQPVPEPYQPQLPITGAVVPSETASSTSDTLSVLAICTVGFAVGALAGRVFTRSNGHASPELTTSLQAQASIDETSIPNAWPKKTAAAFFGGADTPTPKTGTSYKDYNDRWLGGADLGFDPLNLAVGSGTFDTAATAVPETTYYNYRESEVKHGRFAMTAFLAIFFEEADRGAVLQQLGFSGAVDNLDATLGLDEVQGPVLAIGVGIQALAEYNLQKSEDDGNFLSVEYKAARCPGDLGFDPLSIAGTDKNKAYLHNVEVNTGRLAMIGVTSFLFKEFVAKDL